MHRGAERGCVGSALLVDPGWLELTRALFGQGSAKRKQIRSLPTSVAVILPRSAS